MEPETAQEDSTHVDDTTLKVRDQGQTEQRKSPPLSHRQRHSPSHSSTSPRCSHGEGRRRPIRGGRQGLGGLECLRGGTAAGLQRVNRTLGGWRDGGRRIEGYRDEIVESAATPPCLGKRKACKACRFRAHTNSGPP
ncbi:unnamed protein product [Pleuronectes platessa]|uniref:Uncharacterized protein n=1 Tax=Pleuronectes platessa TaxID=8262 RepID=A0A9N7UBJ6_PLEPL|nr:unnamed protein product [Pleuronectes platessa]